MIAGGLRLVAWAAGVAVLLGTLLALAQDRLIFPRWAMGPPAPLPAGAERLTATSADGHRLAGVLIPARGAAEWPVLLAFGGNAWDATVLAGALHGWMPERTVVAFHYRG